MSRESSLAIALNGLGCYDERNCHLIATAGFGFGCIQIIIPPIPFHPELLGGGFANIPRPIPTPSLNKKPPIPMPINIRITINGKTSMRTFMVRPRKYRAIVKIVNIINATTRMMNISIDNIKRATAATVNIMFGDK